MSFIKAIKKSELSPGEGKIVSIQGKSIAVFNVDGNNFFAIDNTCPHMGGPLGEGLLTGDVVSCPWHGWRFNVKTGVSPVMPAINVKKYKTKVEGSDVLVEI